MRGKLFKVRELHPGVVSRTGLVVEPVGEMLR